MTNFSTGPWEIGFEANGELTILAGGNIIARTEASRKKSIRDANAKLIAAAPEMYDELYEILQFIRYKTTLLGSHEYARWAKDIEELLARIDGKEK